MYKSIILLTAIIIIFSCSSEKKGIHSIEINPKFTEIEVNASIRAIEVKDDKEMWFAGSNGLFGYTKDGGISWHMDSIQIGENTLEFRAIAKTSKSLFLLNVASPAYLLKSVDEGKNWSIVYQEDHPEIFYNSMKFWDIKNGIAVGDPIDGCLSVIITSNGGNSWEKLNCDQLPSTYEGEAGFAASNTNIAVFGDHTWLATGGRKARVFYSPDKGKSWEVFDTPINQDGKMTGIFSIEFRDENHGIVFGGDWEDQHNNKANKATSTDGGKTWKLLNDGDEPGYRSCVQFVPNTQGQKIFAVGIPGISYSADHGQTWQHIDQTYFYTIRINKKGNSAWLAGKNKIAKMEW